MKSETCPKCGSVLIKVVLTRIDPNGFKIRRRWCRLCDHRYYTVQGQEVVISKYDLKWSGSRRFNTEVLSFKGDLERITGVGDASGGANDCQNGAGEQSVE